jgi:predicted kinase
MRKWTRDRAKRRSKATEKPQETAAAPLQPAYFEQAIQESQPKQERVESAPDVESSAPEPQDSQEASPTAQHEADDKPKRRRRRGRGGRGRKRPADAGNEAQATEPASTPEPASAPEPVPAPMETSPGAEFEASPAPTAVSTPTTPRPAAARPPKGVVVLAIGLPGSGKSSWFKRHNITPLSSDLLRQLLFDDATEQRFQDLIFSNLRSMLKARLIARRPMNYVDATNLTTHDRHSWIKLAKDFGYEVQAVFFDVPVEVCRDRNQKRSRVVSEEVMRRMAGKLKPPTFEEGFTKITVVRVKHKE